MPLFECDREGHVFEAGEGRDMTTPCPEPECGGTGWRACRWRCVRTGCGHTFVKRQPKGCPACGSRVLTLA